MEQLYIADIQTILKPCYTATIYVPVLDFLGVSLLQYNTQFCVRSKINFALEMGDLTHAVIYTQSQDIFMLFLLLLQNQNI